MSQKSISLQTMLSFLLSTVFYIPPSTRSTPLTLVFYTFLGTFLFYHVGLNVSLLHTLLLCSIWNIWNRQKKGSFYHPIHHSRLFQTLALLKVGFKICHTGLFIRIILSVYWSKISLVWEYCNSILYGVCCKEVHSCTHIACCSTACSQR